MKQHTILMAHAALLFTLVPLLSACSDKGEARTEIAKAVEIPKSEAPDTQKLSTKERVGLERPATAAASSTAPASGAPDTSQGKYAWILPEGWEDRGATSMRLANLGIAGQPGVECTFTVLGGDGGGLAANVNRWRKQLGQAPYLPEEIDALPKKPLLGQEAVYTIMDGTYSGMGGQEAMDNWRMLGLTLIHEGTAYFVKMTGPATVLESEEAKFLAFAESIQEAKGATAAAPADHAHAETRPELPPDHPPVSEAEMKAGLPDGHPPIASSTSELPDGHPPIAANTSELPDGHPPIAPNASASIIDAGAASASGYHWHAPESWVKAPDKAMREVTYTVEDAECYVSVLGGAAGGVDANINRWVAQMGQEPLSPEALKALPTITVLGVQSPLVEVKGSFTGMSGGTVPGQMLLGAVCSLEGQTLFIKMTGPEEVVAEQAGNFVAFCESIHK